MNTTLNYLLSFYNLLVDGESSRKIKNLEKHKVRRRDKGTLKC